MIDLLIKQVTEGLSPDEQRGLDVMDSETSSEHLRDLERASAAIAVAGSAGGEPLPEALKRRLVQDAERHFARASAAGGAISADSGAAEAVSPAEGRRADAAAPRSDGGARRPSPALRGAWGWLAAAACLVVAVVAWNRRPASPPVVEVKPPPVQATVPPPAPPAPPTPAEERARLLAKSDAIKVTLGATKDPSAAGVSGDVVWDQATQRGFVRFAGLAPNDPAVHQYQVWIFDGGRDKRYPVDAGVFDIPANSSEVVIPIHAALQVISPKAFAVTIEKPGGVVVSGREHVVALGAAG